MDEILLARSMFGMTMAFHIIFATLGVGLPLMILIAELLFWRTKDKDYELMAKRWTKGQAILLGVAIPSGTIAGVQLSLLWPGFMEVVGKVIALPFQIEIFAFFLEALFLSLYVYAADRLTPWMRIVSVFLVLVGATASAVLITNVHAFEGTPAGFRLVDGEIVDVDPWAAFFNPSFFVTAGHVTVSAFMTGAFVIASVAAWKMIRAKAPGREYLFHQKALLMGLIIGGTFSLLTALNGHESAQYLHHYQPEKLAAAEGLFETQPYAPLVIGGLTDPETQEVKYGIEIPWMLSFLAGNRFDEVVVGLNDFPREYWPPLFVHTLFNAMVGIGSLLILVGFVGFAWKKLLKKDRYPRWAMWLFVASGPLAMLGIEFGWIFACTGRQPWVIYRMMLTSEAATRSEGLGVLFGLFLAVYLLLAIVTILVFLSYFRRHPLPFAKPASQVSNNDAPKG
ncbi:cytochrome ubiquinol oxidase subunit I [Brevibacillus humidisoli]|uniref:cytochrome ubiquinol oxidase subunit I n=1 Tax=Brevibacillus humidisoli TaxID=2895522 RepID=UPI001E4DC019|nr:cytochrome ubiquinol oxidase subunit I [Brevibacillus humidisoli]UFJ39572.1 cytochrome ubiquinol oxidase subunit I [Brevibacillus humidisoli]